MGKLKWDLVDHLVGELERFGGIQLMNAGI